MSCITLSICQWLYVGELADEAGVLVVSAVGRQNGMGVLKGCRHSLEAAPLVSLNLLQSLLSLQAPPIPLCGQRLLMLPVRGRQQAP